MALYQYILALLLTFHAWADRSEPSDARAERFAELAGDIVNAVEESFPGDAEQQRDYAVTLVYLGWRETTLRRAYAHATYVDRDAAGRSWGTARGYWSEHGEGTARSAIARLVSTPDWARVGRWCLPAPRPWEGLPSAAAFLRTHAMPPATSAPWERGYPISASVAAAR